MKNFKKLINKNLAFYKIAIFYLQFLRKLKIKYFYLYSLKSEFKNNLGYGLNLDNPKTFNEKLQWLKVYYRDPVMNKCADKYEVRELIAESIGKEYLTPIYGTYDSVDEIELDKLPNKFVLKSNHASGHIIICEDKSRMDWSTEFKKMRKWLNVNYYYVNGEWVYKDIKPKIICEKLLSGEIIDYKFMCFYGSPEMVFTCSERSDNLKVTFFDREFNKLPFIRKYPNSSRVQKPKYFEKMLELSKILSQRFPFVRVDFYENEGKVYFGELTFFPGNGMEWFEPVEWDYKLGEMLDLLKVRKEYLCKR